MWNLVRPAEVCTQAVHSPSVLMYHTHCTTARIVGRCIGVYVLKSFFKRKKKEEKIAYALWAPRNVVHWNAAAVTHKKNIATVSRGIEDRDGRYSLNGCWLREIKNLQKWANFVGRKKPDNHNHLFLHLSSKSNPVQHKEPPLVMRAHASVTFNSMTF